MAYKVKLDHQKTVTLILIKGVGNTEEIRKLIMSGDLKCCIIKPSLVVDPFQIVVAANKAVINLVNARMATKNIYAEILFNLSLTKNITTSLRTFGIDDSCKEFFLCTLESDEETEEILAHIQGERCPIEEIKRFSNVPLIRLEYKIPDIENNVSSLVDSVVSRIVAKDFGAL